jgi:hypothetical protein
MGSSLKRTELIPAVIGYPYLEVLKFVDDGVNIFDRLVRKIWSLSLSKAACKIETI